MPHKFVRLISLLLCFCLFFQQSGLAQVAGQLDISGYLTSLRSSFTQDKFRPLHLRYLSYDTLNNNFKLLLDKGDQFKGLSPQGTVPELESATKELLNYFFIGVTLPNDSFWVNLRPDSPDNIIDDYLAQTDVGRILLEADLQLKKDTASYTSPQTLEGKKYWDKLYKKAEELLGQDNITIPTLVRPWIVPGEIIIREAKDNAYIYKATLKVMLEDDYLKNSSTYNFKDPRLKALNEYSSQLIKELIIPKLIKEVNTSKKYAHLRQVYYSLILAQWFKARFYGKGGLYSYLIDKKNLTGLMSQSNWSKTAYFKEYQKSFKDGEYNVKEPVSTSSGQSVRSYFSGGIQLVAPEPYPATPPSAASPIISSGPYTAMYTTKSQPKGRYLLVGGFTGATAASPAEGKIEIAPGLEKSASSPVAGEFNQASSSTKKSDWWRRSLVKITAGSIRALLISTALLAPTFPTSAQTILASALQSPPQTTVRDTNQKIDALIKALTDPVVDVRANAADALGKLQDPKAIDVLIKTLTADPVARVSTRAAYALGKFKDPKATDALIKTALTEHVYLRACAADALGKLQDPKATDALIKALTDPVVDVRANAAFALGYIQDPKATDALIKALTDQVVDVRANATFALGKLQDPKATDALIKTLTADPVAKIRANAADALGKLQDPKATDALIKTALTDQDVYVRYCAACALRYVQDPKATDALIKTLTADLVVDVRANAAFALGYIQDPKATDALIKTLTADPVAKIRANAAYALGERSVVLDDQHPYKKLFSCFKNRNEDIQAGGLSPRNLFLIYGNQEFRTQTDSMHMVHQFTLARAIDNILSRFHREVNDKNIEIALPFALEAWKSSSERLVLDKNSRIIASFHEESILGSFDPKGFAGFLHRQFGIDTDDPQAFVSFKGSRNNEELRRAKEGLRSTIEDPHYNVLYLDHHGGTRHVWFTQGQNGIQESEELHRPDALSYQELAENLFNRAKNNQGVLSDLTIIISACYSADFAVNTLNELAGLLAEGQIKDLPAIITATNRGTAGYQIFKSIEQVSRGNDSLHWSDFYEIQIMEWHHQQMAFFLFIPQEKLSALKEALGVLGEVIAPAVKGTGKQEPQAVPERVLPLGSPHDPGEGEIAPLRPALPVINTELVLPGRDTQKGDPVLASRDFLTGGISQNIGTASSPAEGGTKYSTKNQFKPGVVRMIYEPDHYKRAEFQDELRENIREADIVIFEFPEELNGLLQRLSDGQISVEEFSNVIQQEYKRNGAGILEFPEEQKLLYKILHNSKKHIIGTVPLKSTIFNTRPYETELNRALREGQFRIAMEGFARLMYFMAQWVRETNEGFLRLIRQTRQQYPTARIVAIAGISHSFITHTLTREHIPTQRVVVGAVAERSITLPYHDALTRLFIHQINIGQQPKAPPLFVGRAMLTNIWLNAMKARGARFQADFALMNRAVSRLSFHEIEQLFLDLTAGRKTWESVEKLLTEGSTSSPANSANHNIAWIKKMEEETRNRAHIIQDTAVPSNIKVQLKRMVDYAITSSSEVPENIGQDGGFYHAHLLAPLTILLKGNPDEDWEVIQSSILYILGHTQEGMIFDKTKRNVLLDLTTGEISNIHGGNELGAVSVLDFSNSVGIPLQEVGTIYFTPLPDGTFYAFVNLYSKSSSWPATEPSASSPATSSPLADFTDSEKKLIQAMILAMEGYFKRAVDIMADPHSFEEQGFTLNAQMAQRYLSYYGPVRDVRGSTRFRAVRENLIDYISHNVSEQLARDFATAMYSLRTKYDSIVDLAIKLKIKEYTRSRVLFKGQSEKITKYVGPIKVILSPNLPGSVTLLIYKLQDIPAGLPVNDGSLNPVAEYFIIKDGGAAGEMAGLWDADLPQYSGKKVVLGRHHPGRFTGLSGSYISREHVTIYRRGDAIFIESNSDNGTFVAWVEEREASDDDPDSAEAKDDPAKATLITHLQSIKEMINRATLRSSNGRKDLVLLNGRIVDQRLDEIQTIVMNGLIHDSIAPLEEELGHIEEETRRILDYFQRYSVLDYWQRLRLRRGASQADIKRQFRQLMLEFHPDRYQNGDSRPHPISQVVAGQIARWLNEANDHLSSSPTAASSSPAQTTSDKGGIDFRALPITTQPVTPLSGTASHSSQGPSLRSGSNFNRGFAGNLRQSLSNVNLDTEWSQIQNMLQSGIIPSSERIKEYLEACCVKDSMDKEIDKVLACIADILRLEEERCQITEAGLKELLVLLESNKPVQDMQRALINITILPKEPAIKP